MLCFKEKYDVGFIIKIVYFFFENFIFYKNSGMYFELILIEFKKLVFLELIIKVSFG